MYTMQQLGCCFCHTLLVLCRTLATASMMLLGSMTWPELSAVRSAQCGCQKGTKMHGNFRRGGEWSSGPKYANQVPHYPLSQGRLNARVPRLLLFCCASVPQVWFHPDLLTLFPRLGTVALLSLWRNSTLTEGDDCRLCVTRLAASRRSFSPSRSHRQQ